MLQGLKILILSEILPTWVRRAAGRAAQKGVKYILETFLRNISQMTNILEKYLRWKYLNNAQGR